MEKNKSHWKQGFADRLNEMIDSTVGNHKGKTRRFAELCQNVKEESLRTYVKGQTTPELRNIIEICKAGKRSAEWLLSGQDENNVLDIREARKFQNQPRAEELLNLLLELEDLSPDALDKIRHDVRNYVEILKPVKKKPTVRKAKNGGGGNY